MKTSFDKCTICRGTGNVLGKRKFADASRKYGIQSCHAEFCPKCAAKIWARMDTEEILELLAGITPRTSGNLKIATGKLASK